MDYHFESVQNLKLGIYDIDNSSSDLGDDDYLGGVELTLGQVQAHTRKTCTKLRRKVLLFCFGVFLLLNLVQMGIKFTFRKIHFQPAETLNLTNIQLNFDSVSICFSSSSSPCVSLATVTDLRCLMCVKVHWGVSALWRSVKVMTPHNGSALSSLAVLQISHEFVEMMYPSNHWGLSQNDSAVWRQTSTVGSKTDNNSSTFFINSFIGSNFNNRVVTLRQKYFSGSQKYYELHNALCWANCEHTHYYLNDMDFVLLNFTPP